MSGINSVTIIGRLGADPEIRFTANGSAVVNISVATSERWKNKQTGEQEESIEWTRIVIFSKLAEIANQYLKKGSLAYFSGRLKTRKYQDQSGVDKYITEVIANKIEFLDRKPDSKPPAESRQPAQQEMGGGNGGFDDTPFAPIDHRCA